MKLIRATATEAAGMAQAHAGAFADSWREEDFEDLLEGDGVFGFLAVDDEDRPLGVILSRIAAGEMEVLTVGVRPEARRLGVAKALMTAALGVARQAGAEACFLEVAVDNDGAGALYAGLGFRRAGLRKRYYDRGAEGMIDALVMRLDLNTPA
ncbi:GNAT family N-acetyltransferase [Phenylobacterium soli]|uniref:Ribosomal-protein-alanine acetyltransferase n=1 Tax=Phenylobacterium soli TaxID=2170551 RepID=A0A328AKR8_9CAUL|nr:GNAT family N-acetyltransferase [Phenylobacterium soli]RAK53468.1 ribosomal-protein-alanine acetyltransferase [Phenylobacterium soli]